MKIFLLDLLSKVVVVQMKVYLRNKIVLDFRKSCLGNIFAFAEHQEKATFGWGNKITLKRNIDNTKLSRNVATDDWKSDIKGDIWFIPHYNPSGFQQGFLDR